MTRVGFTLVELTVALAIGGAVIAVAASAVAFLSDRSAATEFVTTERMRQASARRDLARWLAGARVLPGDIGPPFTSIDGEREGLPDDMLSFLTTAATPVLARHAVVRLFVDRDASTPETGLVADVAAWNGSGAIRVQIEPSVESFDVDHVVGAGADRRRLRSWNSASLLPDIVTLDFGAESELAALFRVPLIIAVGAAR